MRTALMVAQAAITGWLLLRRVAGRRAEASLEERLRFEALLSHVSAGLIHVEASQFSAALQDALRHVAVFLGADRGTVEEHSDRGPGIRVSWAAPGVEPLPHPMQEAQFPWTADRLAGGESVRFSRPDRLPEQASVDRAGYQRVGTRSHISVPVRGRGQILGVLSFDAVRQERAWADEVVERMGLLGEAFASALERHRVEVALAERLRFERLLSMLGATFSTLSAVDLDRELSGALRRVTDFIGAERGTVLEFDRDGRIARTWATGEWFDPAGFPYLTARLQRGELVHICHVDELGDEASVDRGSYLALRVKPRLAAPLVAGGPVVGGLVLGTMERAASDELIQQVPLLAEVFANALSRKQAELEAQRLRQELAHIGRVSAMGELTASLAHELNQPLSAILNYAYAAQRLLAAESVDLDEIREILGEIVADDKRAGAIISRLRGLLKKGDPAFVSLDLDEIASEVARLVKNDTLTRNVTMILQLAGGLPRVRGDRAQLQQVVLNLVINGLEAMQAPQARGRTLIIRTSRDAGATVRLEVEDSGTGIDEQNVAVLFRSLYTTKPEGLGMGLAIARTIVEAHGGRLAAANNAHGGATFHFTLPVYTDAGEP